VRVCDYLYREGVMLSEKVFCVCVRTVSLAPLIGAKYGG